MAFLLAFGRSGKVTALTNKSPVQSILPAYALIAFAFLLPTDLDPVVYGGLVGIASILFIAPNIKLSAKALFPPEYWVFGGFLAFYLFFSIFHVLPTGDHLLDNSYIAHQISGLLILFVTYPAFAEASRMTLRQKFPAKFIFVIALLAIGSTEILRPGENLVLGGQLYGALAPVLLLQFAWFALAQRLVNNRFLQAVLMLAVTPLMGASTNVLIQILAALICLVPDRRKIIFGMCLVVPVFIYVMAFPPPLIRELLADDPNSFVRSQMWNGTLQSIAKFPIGIGFGTSYTDYNTMHEPSVHWVYSLNYLRSFEVANHNSFIDVLQRLGVIGFIATISLFSISWMKIRSEEHLKIASFLLGVSILICALNPIIESARSVLFVALTAGYLRAAAYHEATNCSSQAKADDQKLVRQNPGERRRRLAAAASAS